MINLLPLKIEYRIVCGSYFSGSEQISDLEEKVNELIKEGWYPLGGPFVTGNCWSSDEGRNLADFGQAMTREI